MRQLFPFRRLGATAVLALAVLVPGIACSHSACAATLDAGSYSGSSSSGARTYSPPSNSGSRSYSSGSSGSSSSGSKTYSPPSNSGSRSNTYQAPSSSGSRASSSGSSGSYTYRAPSGATYNLPTRITGRTYTSPTGSSFTYHVHSYYHVGGYHDPWDPYDWTNYNNPASPWYHDAHLIAANC